MTDWKTIKVPPEYFDRAKDYKPEGKDVTWGDCLVAGAERLNDHMDSDPPPGMGGVEVPIKPTLDGEDVDALADQIRDQLDVLAFDGALTEEELERIESSLSTIEERTGKIERQLEGMQR